MNLPRRRDRRGFTLVELMVVIAIIGLLATVVTVNVINQMSDARVQKVKGDIKAIKDACKLFNTNMGYYPQQFEDLWQAPPNAGNRWKGPYLDEDVGRPPVDPWGNPYVFEQGRPPKIISYGADGRPGGQEEAADIDSTNLSEGGDQQGR